MRNPRLVVQFIAAFLVFSASACGSKTDTAESVATDYVHAIEVGRIPTDLVMAGSSALMMGYNSALAGCKLSLGDKEIDQPNQVRYKVHRICKEGLPADMHLLVANLEDTDKRHWVVVDFSFN